MASQLESLTRLHIKECEGILSKCYDDEETTEHLISETKDFLAKLGAEGWVAHFTVSGALGVCGVNVLGKTTTQDVRKVTCRRCRDAIRKAWGEQ